MLAGGYALQWIPKMKIDLADYEESGEWDLVASSTERRLLTDGVDTHSEIAFSMKLRRKPMYYVTTILIPVIVTSILCIVVFLLPAESGEKVGYALTILLTYTVMLTLVASYMPPTSKHTSVLSVYLTVILFIGVFTTVITVLVLHMHERPQEQRVPAWLQFLTSTCMLPLTRWRPRHLSVLDDVPQEHSNRQPRLRQHIHRTIPRSGSHVYHTDNGCSPQSSDKVSVTTFSSRRHFMEKNHHPGGSPDEVNHEQIASSRDGIYQFTWPEVGVLLDALCLRLLGMFVLTLTLIVLLTMIIGGRW